MLAAVRRETTTSEVESNITALSRMKSRETIRFRSGWGRVVTLIDLIRAKVIDESTVLQLETQQVCQWLDCSIACGCIESASRCSFVR